jgi:Protein of unknown function (DUF1826)
MNALRLGPDPRVGDRHRLVWNEHELRLIRRTGLDLCVWRRGLDSHFSWWCQRVSCSHRLHLDEELSVEELRLDALLSSLPAGTHRQMLCDDIAARVRLKLSVLDDQQCPRFHVDNVGVRLITSYAGPATEWLAESDVVRGLVGPGSGVDLPARPRAVVQQLARFDVALMKGRSWPGNRAFGVVHRSPRVGDQPRLVLTLDARSGA